MAPSAVAEPQSQTFGYTGAAQPFVVPEGVFAITVDAYGAAGGNGGPWIRRLAVWAGSVGVRRRSCA